MTTPSPKTMLLVDGCGAALSALCLGVVLPALQDWIGMPPRVLYLLAALALLFALSGAAAYRWSERAPRWLRWISAANLLYCALTLTLVALHFEQLTAWGLAYFVAEVALILALVLAEQRALRGAAASG